MLEANALRIVLLEETRHSQLEQFLSEIDFDYGDMQYHIEVRWLSKGKVPECFFI